MTRHLRAVDNAPAEAPLDITLAIRADIEKRDWERCHIEGDKNPPLLWLDRVRARVWR